MGATWDDDAPSLQLAGNLARFPSQPLLLTAAVGQFQPVRLAFAWTQAEQVPLILGQMNFFLEFDVCFLRSQNAFEVKPERQ